MNVSFARRSPVISEEVFKSMNNAWKNKTNGNLAFAFFGTFVFVGMTKFICSAKAQTLQKV